MKEEREKKEEKLKVLPKVGFLMKMRAKLKEQPIGDNNPTNQKFNLKMEKLEPWESVKGKMDK